MQLVRYKVRTVNMPLVLYIRAKDKKNLCALRSTLRFIIFIEILHVRRRF